MTSEQELPVACCLTDAEFREREAVLLARFRALVREVDGLEDGYAVRVPGDSDSLRVAMELMIAERQCCPFLEFTLTAAHGMGPLKISVTGPAGAKEFLKKILLSGLG